MSRQSGLKRESGPAGWLSPDSQRRETVPHYGPGLIQAIYAELRCYRTKIDYQAADVAWQDARQAIIADNPPARRAQNHYRRLSQELRRLTGAGYNRYDPKVVDLRNQLERANLKQQKTARWVLNGNPRLIAVSKTKEQARLVWSQAETKLEQARGTALAGLTDHQGNQPDWAEIDGLIEPELKQSLIISGLRLAQTQSEHQQSILAVCQAVRAQFQIRDRPLANQPLD